MSGTVADALVARLQAWGVSRVFGYPGDGINGVMGALRRAGGRPELVQARHEEMTAFMASGHARYTGEVGVCLSTQGPGAVHLLTGLYDAKLDHVPVVAVIGQQSSSVLGSAYQQELDLRALFGDVAAQFIGEVRAPEQALLVLDRALRVALATRSPTCVIVPHDLQSADAVDELPHAHGVLGSSVGHRPPVVVPHDNDLRAAAAVLSVGERVAILVGQGARHAVDEVIEVAEVLGAGVATSLMGKPVLGDDLPFATGCLGHLGTTASDELMQRCDTLLTIGSNDPWTEFYPPPGAARAVQIDLDGRNLGLRYPNEVDLIGDAATTLRALLPLLERRADRRWRHQVEASVQRWWTIVERRAMAPAEPVNPQRVLWELSPRLPDDVLLAVDVGSVTYWYARCLKLRPGTPAHLSSTLASMGSAVPFGIAAKLAHPDRPVVALAGDGAMQMNGNAELVTVAHRWRGWADPRFVVLVLRNDDLNEVTWEQRETEGDPRYAASQDLPAFDYAGYAELLGLRGIRVDDPDAIGPAWDEALSADRPTLIEAVVDPAVPLLAPRLEADTVAQMEAALRAEGPDGERALAALTRERADQGDGPMAD